MVAWYDRIRNAALQLAFVLIVVGAAGAWLGGPAHLYGAALAFLVGVGNGLAWWARRY